MRRALVLILALLWAAPVAAYERLAFQPQHKTGEFRVGHRIVQTTGANAGSVGRIVAGGDSTTRSGYSLIIDTTDTFDSGEWVNDPFTGGQVLVEYVGTVRTVNSAGGADFVDIGDSADAQCWAASADGDCCFIVGNGTYDLPDNAGAGTGFDKRVAIYAAEYVTAKLTNNVAAGVTLETDMSAVTAGRGWTEFVGVEIEQDQNTFLWDWTLDDDMILFSRVQFDYDNAADLARLFINDFDDGYLFHFLKCWNTNSDTGTAVRFVEASIWVDYLFDECAWTYQHLSFLYGRGVFRNCYCETTKAEFRTTTDGMTYIANNVLTTSDPVLAGSGMMLLTSNATSQRVVFTNNTVYVPNAGANPVVRSQGAGEGVVSGNIVEGDGNCTAFYAQNSVNQRLYDNRWHNVAAGVGDDGVGSWVDDNNSALTSSPFVNAAAAPPDLRLNATAGGGAACQGIVRRLPVVSPDTDITGYPRDREVYADAGAWQYRDLIAAWSSSGSADEDWYMRLVKGQTSGATGLVRWAEVRHDGALHLVIEQLIGTFGSETIDAMSDDYSDVPVGMWGGPFAPERPTMTRSINLRAVHTVCGNLATDVQLADYAEFTNALYTAMGSFDVIWFDDSEHHNAHHSTLNQGKNVNLVGAPWHLPEFTKAGVDVWDLMGGGGYWRYWLSNMRIAPESTEYGVISSNASVLYFLSHVEVVAAATAHEDLVADTVGGNAPDVEMQDVLLIADDGKGLETKSDGVYLYDVTVDYPSTGIHVNQGRDDGEVIADGIKVWESDQANGGIFLDNPASGDQQTWRNVIVTSRGTNDRLVRLELLGAGATTDILIEGLSGYQPGAGVNDDGFCVFDHDADILTIRGTAIQGPAGHEAFRNTGSANITSEYNCWHGYGTGFSGNWADTGSVNDDPDFTDTAATPMPNLYPDPTSPVLGLVAANATCTTDVDGRSRRRTATDAGAYERFGDLSAGQRTVRVFLGYGAEPRPGQQWFERGEAVVASGGATGVIESVSGDEMLVDVLSETWAAAETVTGASGAMGTAAAVGDVHPVGPRHDRDHDTVDQAVAAAGHGDVITLRDGWVGGPNAVPTQRNLYWREPTDYVPVMAWPIPRARRMDPTRGRYIAKRGVAIYDASDDEFYFSATGSTDGWQGWVDIAFAGHTNGVTADLVRVAGAGNVLVRDCLFMPMGQWANLESFDALSGSDDVRVVGTWFRDIVGLTVPADVGLHIQARMPDTAVTGAVVARDNVHEDITEHAYYQDAAAVAAYDITIARCLFRRYWDTAINMTIATAARLNPLSCMFYGAEQPAAYAAALPAVELRGSARIELSSVISDSIVAGFVQSASLHNTAVATGLAIEFENNGLVQAVLGADTSTIYDSVVNGLVNVPTETNIQENTAPGFTDLTMGDPDLHLADGSPTLGLVDPAHLSLVAVDEVDFHGFPVLGWTPNIHAGCLQHPVPGRVPRAWAGQRRLQHAGGLRVPQFTRW